ncbi:unnamed protein product [Amoebophrya sp. A120]|nr:unnamed protein product [Amoebophrya sp. A120]|eukprot:GSA120T00012657001.1
MSDSLKLSMPHERPNRSMENEKLQGPVGNIGKADHPVQKIQLQSTRDKLKMEDRLDTVVFGSHVSMRNRMERTMLAQYQRLPGLQSSFVGLEAHLDLDETLEFEDFLNRKDMAPVPEMGFHHTMHDVLENKLYNK